MRHARGMLLLLAALGMANAHAAIVRQTYTTDFDLRVLDVAPVGEPYPEVVPDADGSFGLRDVDFAFLQLPRFAGAPASLLGVELSLFSVVDGDWRYMPYGEIGYAWDYDSEGPIFGSVFSHNDTSISVQAFYEATLKPFSPDLFPALYAASARGNCSGSADGGILGGVAIECPAEQTGLVPPLFRHEWGLFEGAATTPFLGTSPLEFYALLEGEHWGHCDNDDDGDHCLALTSLAWEGVVSVTYIVQSLSIQGPPGSVPAPATALLLLGGLAGLGAMRGARRTAAPPGA